MENPISINEKQNKKRKIHMENPTYVFFNCEENHDFIFGY